MTKQSSFPRRQSHSPPHLHQPKKPRLTTLAFEPLTSAPNPHYKNKKKKKPRRRKPPTTDASRQWVFSSRDFSNCKDKFVFVSYNILGVENASKHRDLYYKVPRNFWDWNHRKKLICEELTSYNPSILSFQEVDQFDDLYKLLQKYGFRGVYQARTGKARDVCAIFWKDELFSLLHQENIEFKRFGLRDNVAQLCVLKMVEDQSNTNLNAQASEARPSRSLLVGNIHVLFNPNRGDIKLGQIRLFLEKAHKLSEEWGNIPALIGGDLNSMPQSALYQFLASAELDIQLHEQRKICGQNRPLEFPSFQSRNRGAVGFSTSVSRPLLQRWSDEELELATGTTGVTQLRHPLKLCSAYLGVPGSSQTRDGYGEPSATTYHSKFMGTVDYIWHTEELVPVRVLETLPTDVLRKTGGLPSKKWGSDHLALVCELAFADDGNGT